MLFQNFNERLPFRGIITGNHIRIRIHLTQQNSRGFFEKGYTVWARLPLVSRLAGKRSALCCQ